MPRPMMDISIPFYAVRPSECTVDVGLVHNPSEANLSTSICSHLSSWMCAFPSTRFDHISSINEFSNKL